MKKFVYEIAFKNLNTFYLLPAVRLSYDYLDPTYLDVMWFNYGLQFKLPITIKR